jgi:hypothetical protein
MRTIFLWCFLLLFSTGKSQSVSLPDSISIYQFTTDSVKTVLRSENDIQYFVKLLKSRKKAAVKFRERYKIVLHEKSLTTEIEASYKYVRMNGTFRIRKNLDNYFSKLDFRKY